MEAVALLRAVGNLDTGGLVVFKPPGPFPQLPLL